MIDAMNKVSARDVASAAGVSAPVVSWVANGTATQHRIAEATQRRVRAVIERMGYGASRGAGAVVDCQVAELLGKSPFGQPLTTQQLNNLTTALSVIGCEWVPVTSANDLTTLSGGRLVGVVYQSSVTSEQSSAERELKPVVVPVPVVSIPVPVVPIQAPIEGAAGTAATTEEVPDVTELVPSAIPPSTTKQPSNPETVDLVVEQIQPVAEEAPVPVVVPEPILEPVTVDPPPEPIQAPVAESLVVEPIPPVVEEASVPEPEAAIVVPVVDIPPAQEPVVVPETTPEPVPVMAEPLSAEVSVVEPNPVAELPVVEPVVETVAEEIPVPVPTPTPEPVTVDPTADPISGATSASTTQQPDNPETERESAEKVPA